MRAKVQNRIQKSYKSPEAAGPNRWHEMSANYDEKHLVAK